MSHETAMMKSSGVEWIGSIPSHWDVARTRYVAKLESGHTPSRNIPEYWDDCHIPWFTLNDVWQLREGRRYLDQTAETISDLGLANSSARLLPKGTVILSRTASVGFTGILGRPMATTQDFVNWICGPKLQPEYLCYVFQGMSQEFRRVMRGSTHQTIYMPVVQEFSTPIPPKSEQQAIVSMLDRETARIDALVEKKLRLLDLLEEKRLAVITHAVTKGLDPTAAMKESGIEWLGDIPAHWTPIRIANLTNQITNGYVGPTREILVDSGIRYIQSLHIKRGKILFDRGHYFVEEEWSLAHAKSILRRGDVLVVQTGEIGQTALVSDEHEGCNCHALIIMRPRLDRLRGAFLELYLRSDLGQKYLASIQTGALHPHLNCTIIRDLYVPMPPTLDEQDAIVAHIEKVCEPIDRARKQNERSVALLAEYRSALITNAVTGKIDVRGGVAKEAAA